MPIEIEVTGHIVILEGFAGQKPLAHPRLDPDALVGRLGMDFHELTVRHDFAVSVLRQNLELIIKPLLPDGEDLRPLRARLIDRTKPRHGGGESLLRHHLHLELVDLRIERRIRRGESALQRHADREVLEVQPVAVREFLLDVLAKSIHVHLRERGLRSDETGESPDDHVLRERIVVADTSDMLHLALQQLRIARRRGIPNRACVDHRSLLSSVKLLYKRLYHLI